MRLIDADALEKAINKWMPKVQETWMESEIPPIEILAESVLLTIDEQPTVEVLPSAEKTGKWIVKHGILAGDGIYGDMGECSVCGLHLRNYEWNYCPNCGAKMDEVEE